MTGLVDKYFFVKDQVDINGQKIETGKIEYMSATMVWKREGGTASDLDASKIVSSDAYN